MSSETQVPHVTVVGSGGKYSLEASYARALQRLGCTVDFFDLAKAVSRHTKLSRVGQLFNDFVPVEAWVRKANRELFVHVVETNPQVLLIAGSAPVRVGALAQIKVSRPDTKLVLLWPDPFYSMERYTVESLGMFDLVATYSRESVAVVERLGARRACWLPFAADLEIHPPDVTVTEADRAEYSCDVTFIANHRPEREEAVLALLDAGIDVQVWGLDLWRRHARHPGRVRDYFHEKLLCGEDVVRATRCAKVCLNIMDPGNYPGANMRFFENFATRTASVNSPCPELDGQFPDRVVTAYSDVADLVATVRELLGDDDLRRSMSERALELVKSGHTYDDRARSLLAALEIGVTPPTEARR